MHTKTTREFRSQVLVTIAFGIALTSLLGSLYFSDVVGFPPCHLCWWQRVCMYPLTVILAVNFIRKDPYVYRYVLPLSIIGTFFAVYHNTLYYIDKFTPKALGVPCSITGPSCTTPYIDWLGIISIPLLSLLAFVSIIVLMLWYRNTIKTVSK